MASVGCRPEGQGGEGAGLGIDLAAIGRSLGTETVLAMLQIVDQTLARMRTSGHAAILAEMAIVRLAKLEEADAKRKGKDDEKEAKTRAKFEEEKEREEARKRKKLEQVRPLSASDCHPYPVVEARAGASDAL